MRYPIVISVLVFALLVIGAPTYGQQQGTPSLRKMTLDDALPDARGVKRLARLRGLDKITGRATDIDAPSGIPVRFGSLLITVHYCYTRPPEEPPETTAFLQIEEVRPGDAPTRLFSGWMFASTPALHALEHPVFDVWVTGCRTNEVASTAPIAPPASTKPPAAPPAHATAPARTPVPMAVPSPAQAEPVPDQEPQPELPDSNPDQSV